MRLYEQDVNVIKTFRQVCGKTCFLNPDPSLHGGRELPQVPGGVLLCLEITEGTLYLFR